MTKSKIKRCIYEQKYGGFTVMCCWLHSRTGRTDFTRKHLTEPARTWRKSWDRWNQHVRQSSSTVLHSCQRNRVRNVANRCWINAHCKSNQEFFMAKKLDIPKSPRWSSDRSPNRAAFQLLKHKLKVAEVKAWPRREDHVHGFYTSSSHCWQKILIQLFPKQLKQSI